MNTTRLTIVVVALLLAVSSAFAADVRERKFIREGMSEGEVLLKIGKPDSESVEVNWYGAPMMKRWIYLPHPDDARTTTTIVIREGRVAEVDRKLGQ
jgi:hypothetical protein